MNQNNQSFYVYKPKRFYVQVFIATWAFWLFAILFNEGLTCTIGMVLGVLCPASIAIITVFTSKSEALKKDFRRKIFNFWKKLAGGDMVKIQLRSIIPGLRNRLFLVLSGQHGIFLYSGFQGPISLKSGI